MATTLSKRRAKHVPKKGSTFDPTIHEAIGIILEKHNLTLDDKLSTLCEQQEAMRSLIGALSLALKDQDGIDWVRFLN